MRILAVHALFAALLVGSLAARHRSADVLIGDLGLQEQAVFRIARSHGLILHERNDSKLLFKVLEASGCSKPARITFRSITFEEEAILETAPDPGYVRRYFYISLNCDQVDSRAVSIERAKYGLLYTLGLTQYVPTRFLLQIEAPLHCSAIETIDWRPVWGRDYLTATMDKSEGAFQ